ncbi:MAG: hypothetical protein CMI01_17065 [Oceanospirillaceae bacterium]|nr:hypothetical protein [Oceanospirillaceae bacterium]
MIDRDYQLEALVESLAKKRRLEKRLRLLDAIATTGSLTRAAQRLGVSYKTAWNHLRELDRDSGTSLTLGHTGGARGGGSSLTEAGEALLSLMRIYQSRQDPAPPRFAGLRFSARNQLQGAISEIRIDGVIARLTLNLGGALVTSHITRSSIERLALRPKREVYAIIKATTPDLLPSQTHPPGGDVNCIPARIVHCDSSALGRELVLSFGDTAELALARAFDINEESWIKQGARVQLLIKPEEIMIATAD